MITPILAGIVAGLLLQLLLTGFAGYATECCMEDSYAPPLWYAVLSSPLGGIVAVAPGFIAGWLSRTKGILAGFVAGLFGQAIYAGTMHTMWPTVVEEGAVVEMIVRLLALGGWRVNCQKHASGDAGHRITSPCTRRPHPAGSVRA